MDKNEKILPDPDQDLWNILDAWNNLTDRQRGKFIWLVIAAPFQLFFYDIKEKLGYGWTRQ